MSYRPRHPRFRDSLRLPDTWFWQVGSCICVLLLGGGPKGSNLGEVSMSFKKKGGALAFEAKGSMSFRKKG